MSEELLTVRIGNADIEMKRITALPSLSIDSKFRYDFYNGTYKGFDFVAAYPKSTSHEPPMQLQRRMKVLRKGFGKEIVFLFDNLAYYERERLTARNVYYLVSGKYAFLPFLWINAVESDSAYKRADKLLPPGQFILLWHLQRLSLEGMTLTEAAEIAGVSQSAISRAFSQLSAMGLASLQKHADRSKTIHFTASGKDLWNKALPMMDTPVAQIWYCDEFIVEESFVSGINALSKFSALNPEAADTIAVTKEEFGKVKRSIQGLNRLDGNTRIEVWKYRPVSDNGIVDKLSLFLSMRDDKDPRVEKELELLIEKIW